jgi:pimeloyl-ACP methyl ester carboxylesterase
MKLASLAPMPAKQGGSASSREEARLLLPAEDGMPECLGFVPPSLFGRQPPRLAICVHGISRDHREQIALLRDEAAKRGFALLAPHFGERRWPDYQRLGRRGRGPRADLAVDLAVERLEARLGLHFRDRFMIGYSGGSQFVHRYAMAHPDRVRAAVCAAAGWYTFPDADRRYPYGLRVEGALAGVRLEPEAFLRVPMLVAVGRLDTTQEAMRSRPRLDAEQGHDRIERAERWVDAMGRAAGKRRLEPPIELALIEGAGHAFSECVQGGLARLAFDFFEASKGTH